MVKGCQTVLIDGERAHLLHFWRILISTHVKHIHIWKENQLFFTNRYRHTDLYLSVLRKYNTIFWIGPYFLFFRWVCVHDTLVIFVVFCARCPQAKETSTMKMFLCISRASSKRFGNAVCISSSVNSCAYLNTDRITFVCLLYYKFEYFLYIEYILLTAILVYWITLFQYQQL